MNMLSNEQKNKIKKEFRKWVYENSTNEDKIADFFFSKFDELQIEAKEELIKKI